MKDNIFRILFIITAIIAIFFFIGYLQKCTEVDSTEQQLSQMQAAFGDSMKVIKIDNKELSQKVVELSDLNSGYDNLVRDLDFKIFSKNKEIIRLKSIISSGEGHIDTTIVIDSSCIGIKLTYQDVNQFRTLDVGVIINNPPMFTTKETFNPFGITTYLSRDKKGIWVGHAIIDEEFQSFIEISDMKVEIEKDEYAEFYDKTSSLKAGPDGSLYTDFNSKSIFNFGLRTLINETHDLSVQKSLNSPGWVVDYSYLFNIIK